MVVTLPGIEYYGAAMGYEFCIGFFSFSSKFDPLSLKKSLVKPMEKNIYRNEDIIKLLELSTYLGYISFSYSKNQSISK